MVYWRTEITEVLFCYIGTGAERFNSVELTHFIPMFHWYRIQLINFYWKHVYWVPYDSNVGLIKLANTKILFDWVIVLLQSKPLHFLSKLSEITRFITVAQRKDDFNKKPTMSWNKAFSPKGRILSKHIFSVPLVVICKSYNVIFSHNTLDSLERHKTILLVECTPFN